jgi:hypothetical protein
MNSYQIRFVLLKLNTKIHTGCYASNQLHFITSKSFAVVANIEDENHDGMHWCAFYKGKGDSCVSFFDSLGLKEFYKNLR